MRSRLIRWSWGAVCAGTLLAAPAAASIQHPFIANLGQADRAVAFHAPSADGAVAVTRDGAIVYALPGVILRETLIGSPGEMPEGGPPAAVHIQSFKGADPAGWLRDLPSHESVRLGECWPGIRVELVAGPRGVEKLFRLAPGARPGQIRIEVSGANRLGVDESGALRVRTGAGDVTFTAPVAYQDIAGTRTFVEAAYVVSGASYGFALGAYDRTRPLVIDPLLASTFLGGGSDDGMCAAIEVDEDGNIYVAGHTLSLNFPVSPAGYDTLTSWDGDAFVSKLSSDLTTLIASTFLGGSQDDAGFPGAHVALNSQGEVIVSGWTSSNDFPIPGPAYDDDYWAGDDIFIAKLSGDLEDLLAATYLGGHAGEISEGVTVDATDHILLTGSTLSSTFPFTTGAFDSTYHGGSWPFGDVFVSRLTPALDGLVASTFLGGNTYDMGTAVGTQQDGSIVVSGYTWSDDFPVLPSGFQDEHEGGGYDVFVSRLSGDLTQLTGGTFLGAEGSDISLAMAIAEDDAIYVTGHTGSRNFPTAGDPYCRSYQGEGGSDVGDDAFVSRLSPDLTSLLNSTYVGGTLWETAFNLDLDGHGHVYLAGSTNSSDFPTGPDPYDEDYNGGSDQYAGDAWVARMDVGLSELEAGTYLGTSGDEDTGAIRRDGEGNVVVVGSTTSDLFPTTEGAFSRDFGGGHPLSGGDVFVCKFDSLLTSTDPAGAEPIDPASDLLGLRAYPEPASRSGRLRFSLPRPSRIEVAVCDETGRIVRRLATGTLPSGQRELEWDGRDDAGRQVPSGAYFYRLWTPDREETRRVTMIR